MSVIEVDITERYQAYPLWVKLVLLLLATVLLTLAVHHYRQLTKQLEKQQVDHQVAKRVESPEVTAEQLGSFEALKTVETELNVPWLELLGELEKIKAQYPDMIVNSIQPNSESRLLKLTAQIDDFGKVVNFISTMRASRLFSKVSLVQHEDKQRKVQADDQTTIDFALMAEWQANVE